MNYKLKTLIFVFLTLSLISNAQLSIQLNNDSPLTNNGLYFEGEKGVDYQFGKRISPHGDCIDVVNGYVYVTWYRGGMDDRTLMVSRKKVEGGSWKTIEFPDRHIGYRGDPTIGDSHNTAAIAICPIDSTVHLIYDMHAYSKASYPDNYFNYRISKKGSAFVEDEQWSIDLFNNKRHYLREDINYEKSTYPGFLRFDDGRIMIELRFGGSGNGNIIYAIYDGEEWLENTEFNNGNQPAYDDKYSIYGSYQYLHGKLYSGFSIRHKPANDADSDWPYVYNNGLFIAMANSPYGATNWVDYTEKSISLPIQNPYGLIIAEPCEIGIGNKISMGPIWTVTKNGAIHFLTKVNTTSVHYYKPPEEEGFIYSTNCPEANGDIFSLGDRVLNVALESSRVVIRTTPEGQNNWQVLYQQTSGDKYRHFNAVMEEDKLFIYAMKEGSGKAQPITLLTYTVSGISFTDQYKQKNKLKVYPNPTNDLLTIENAADNSIIQLADLQGRFLKEHQIRVQGSTGILDVRKLDPGIYFIKNNTEITKFKKCNHETE